MKAVVKYGQEPDRVELREVPKPKVQPGSVLVEVKAAGVCGWDIEMWRHRTANPVTVPVIQGHEFCGVIAELGEGVLDWQEGDRVACETSAVVCGKCYWCRTGDYQVCPDRKGFGYGVDGAFAKYVLVRQEILHRIPESISFEEAALTEPFCVAHHALVDRVHVAAGDVVAVVGPGPVGLNSLQIARLRGAGRTILIGTQSDAQRMTVAREQHWADHIVNIETEDPIERVMQISGGRGADVVADCAGNASAFNTALESVRRCGQIVKIGWGPRPFDRSLDPLLRKSAILAGTFGHNWRNWEAVLRLFASGGLNPRPLISGVLPLAEWREAFERVESCQAIKMILVPVESA